MLEAQEKSPLRQYAVITANYWAFTLTDGALRMLVVLYFHQLGYSPLSIAMLFLFYEFFGVMTNLVGGWLGSRWGLNNIMNVGLALQIVALGMLLVPQVWLTIAWVMAAQALSGIAKDLNKMSAKSAIKTLVSDDQQGKLYRWVAILTGSKNTLKGVGFFLGGWLLMLFGFWQAIAMMVVCLTVVWLCSLCLLKADIGKAKRKPKFTQLFSKSSAINRLSAARLFLFAARDVWFVVALPVYLSERLAWNHWWIGGFFAFWVILYGVVQAVSPKIVGRKSSSIVTAHVASFWAFLLCFVPALIAIVLYYASGHISGNDVNIGSMNSPGMNTQTTLMLGLAVFGVLFAINSALHSYLIVSLADRETIAMDVGFYYMANAAGRLLGSILSGLVYQLSGLEACLLLSTLFIFIAAIISLGFNQNAPRL